MSSPTLADRQGETGKDKREGSRRCRLQSGIPSLIYLRDEFEGGGFGHARESLLGGGAIFDVADFVGEIGDDQRRHRRSERPCRLGDERD